MSRETGATTNRHSRAAIPVHVPEMERIALPRQRASHTGHAYSPARVTNPNPTNSTPTSNASVSRRTVFLELHCRWEEVGKHHGRTARGAARVMTASLAPSFTILPSRSASPSPLRPRQVVRCSPKTFKKQEKGQLTSSERLQISLAARVDRLLGLVHDAASHCEHGGEGPQLR